MKDMEFSKKLVIVAIATSAVLIVAAIIGMLLDKDATAIAALAGTSILANGSIEGFYFWKAKNENRSKYAQQYVQEFAKEYDIDSAIRIAEVVLKD